MYLMQFEESGNVAPPAGLKEMGWAPGLLKDVLCLFCQEALKAPLVPCLQQVCDKTMVTVCCSDASAVAQAELLIKKGVLWRVSGSATADLGVCIHPWAALDAMDVWVKGAKGCQSSAKGASGEWRCWKCRSRLTLVHVASARCVCGAEDPVGPPRSCSSLDRLEEGVFEAKSVLRGSVWPKSNPWYGLTRGTYVCVPDIEVVIAKDLCRRCAGIVCKCTRCTGEVVVW